MGPDRSASQRVSENATHQTRQLADRASLRAASHNHARACLQCARLSVRHPSGRSIGQQQTDDAPSWWPAKQERDRERPRRARQSAWNPPLPPPTSLARWLFGVRPWPARGQLMIGRPNFRDRPLSVSLPLPLVRLWHIHVSSGARHPRWKTALEDKFMGRH